VRGLVRRLDYGMGTATQATILERASRHTPQRQLARYLSHTDLAPHARVPSTRPFRPMNRALERVLSVFAKSSVTGSHLPVNSLGIGGTAHFSKYVRFVPDRIGQFRGSSHLTIEHDFVCILMTCRLPILRSACARPQRASARAGRSDAIEAVRTASQNATRDSAGSISNRAR